MTPVYMQPIAKRIHTKKTTAQPYNTGSVV